MDLFQLCRLQNPRYFNKASKEIKHLKNTNNALAERTMNDNSNP